ncbi:hypothetical protein N7455_007041 [Penicillium solitum]|uniref:uncharacterized protein n=1 Tax=Penicillium solitum TaxID=60172 RepID=UPI0032C46179|nr:hypothetical protein N7455_007041 [Penicillium solitum]
MNGGVYSVTRLWLSEVARCTQRGLFEAIAGECDELDTTSCQHAMNGDALMNTIVSDPVVKNLVQVVSLADSDRTTAPLIVPSLESNAKRPILSARAPLYRCDRKLSVPSS